MEALQAVLRKVWVQQFYQRNAGFFLVIIFLGFGIQQPATFLISPYFLAPVAASPFYTSLILAFCLLYYFKCFHFLWRSLHTREHEFLYVASLLPAKDLYLSVGLATLGILLPVVLYTTWLGLVGISHGYFAAMSLVTGYNIVLLLAATWIVVNRLKKPIGNDAKIRTIVPFTFPTPFFLWPLRYLWHKERATLLFTKVFSAALLLSFTLLYPYPQYDLRPTYIGFLMAVAAHAMLLQRMFGFQENSLKLYRNLPVPLWQKYIRLLLLFLLLLLPEGFILLRFFHQHWSVIPQLISLYAFGMSLLAAFYVLLYKPHFNQETYLRQVFFLFMGLLLFFLYQPPLWPLLALFLLFAFGLYYKWYWRYEPEELA